MIKKNLSLPAMCETILEAGEVGKPETARCRTPGSAWGGGFSGDATRWGGARRGLVLVLQQ